MNDSESVARLREALDQVGTLPICGSWMYTAIRHCVRNEDIDVEDGFNEPEKYAGPSIALILNELPSLLDRIEALNNQVEEHGDDL